MGKCLLSTLNGNKNNDYDLMDEGRRKLYIIGIIVALAAPKIETPCFCDICLGLLVTLIVQRECTCQP